jgi:hypothetical protein
MGNVPEIQHKVKKCPWAFLALLFSPSNTDQRLIIALAKHRNRDSAYDLALGSHSPEPFEHEETRTQGTRGTQPIERNVNA